MWALDPEMQRVTCFVNNVGHKIFFVVIDRWLKYGTWRSIPVSRRSKSVSPAFSILDPQSTVQVVSSSINSLSLHAAVITSVPWNWARRSLLITRWRWHTRRNSAALSITPSSNRLGKMSLILWILFTLWNPGIQHNGSKCFDRTMTFYLFHLICVVCEAKDNNNNCSYIAHNRTKGALKGLNKSVCMCVTKRSLMETVLVGFQAVGKWLQFAIRGQ